MQGCAKNIEESEEKRMTFIEMILWLKGCEFEGSYKKSGKT